LGDASLHPNQHQWREPFFEKRAEKGKFLGYGSKVTEKKDSRYIGTPKEGDILR